MTAMQLDIAAVSTAADRLRDAGTRVASSPPLPLAGPPEVASAITSLVHAERRLADATAALLVDTGIHARQVVTDVTAVDR